VPSAASQVNLELRWDELFDLPVELHLVSSGPSYYLRSLARSHPRFRSHFIRSEYTFDQRCGLICLLPHLLIDDISVRQSDSCSVDPQTSQVIGDVPLMLKLSSSGT